MALESGKPGRYMEVLDVRIPLSYFSVFSEFGMCIRTQLLPSALKTSISSYLKATATSNSSVTPLISSRRSRLRSRVISATCCSNASRAALMHRVLLSGPFEVPTKQKLADALLQKGRDLMVFAGLIRYKLPPRVCETLAKGSQKGSMY